MYAFALAILAVAAGDGTHYSGTLWYYADNCPACTAMEPAVQKLVIEGKPILMVNVAMTWPDFARNHIKFVPTTVVYYRGIVVSKVEHPVDEKELRRLVKLSKGP